MVNTVSCELFLDCEAFPIKTINKTLHIDRVFLNIWVCVPEIIVFWHLSDRQNFLQSAIQAPSLLGAFLFIFTYHLLQI